MKTQRRIFTVLLANGDSHRFLCTDFEFKDGVVSLKDDYMTIAQFATPHIAAVWAVEKKWDPSQQQQRAE